MIARCQIIEVDDETIFLQSLKQSGRPAHLGKRREIYSGTPPAIHTTIEIFKGGTSVGIFRVIYHHLMLTYDSPAPKSEVAVEGCFVFVVRID